MLSDDVLVPLGDVRHGAGLAVLADVGLLALLGRLLLRVDPLVVEHVLRHVLVPRDLGNLKSVLRSMRISLHDALLIGYFDYHRTMAKKSQSVNHQKITTVTKCQLEPGIADQISPNKD